jgi:signal transduction histidine kinase
MGKSISDDLAKYSLLEITIHVIGNELTVISGYTQLLQRAASTHTQEAFSPERDRRQQQNEQWLYYLQIMRQRETLLNDFLAQLRVLSQEATKKRLSQCVVRTDLVLLLRQIIEQLAPLRQDRTIQTHLPVQPLYVLCDLFLMELLLEHIITHTVDAHTLSTPVDIGIKHSKDPSTMLQEARIEIRIKSGLLRQQSGTDEPFEIWSLTLDPRDLDICKVLCRAILYEHGGRMWIEQEAEQEEIVVLTLPLME